MSLPQGKLLTAAQTRRLAVLDALSRERVIEAIVRRLQSGKPQRRAA